MNKSSNEINTWRCLESGPSNAFRNMAVDEALLLCFEPLSSLSILRFYLWEPPGLSLGYFQKACEVDLSYCKTSGADLVRRPTGGRAILHEHEITYSIVMPVSNGVSVLESFKKINQALCSGLNLLGLPAILVPHEKKADPADPKNIKVSACFASPSWYEVQVDGKKILGSAQTRKKGVLLQHGSLLLRLEREKLYSMFNFSSEEKKKEALSESFEKMTSAEEILGNIPPEEAVCAALRHGFEEEYEIRLSSSSLSAEEERVASALEREKYRTSAWNLRR
ncbi:MAG: biotin/lipoate A/B protein ligase family protein [bacterium]